MGRLIDVLISLICWCGMFVSIAVQANPMVTLTFCWLSGCFASLFINANREAEDGNNT